MGSSSEIEKEKHDLRGEVDLFEGEDESNQREKRESGKKRESGVVCVEQREREREKSTRQTI